jgi:hypothetical protein
VRRCQRSEDDYYLVQDVDGGPLGRRCRRILQRPPSTLRNVDGGPLGGADRESKSAHYKRLETSTIGPLGGGAEESKSSHHQCLETLMAGPLGGGGRESRSIHHQHLETSMMGTLGGSARGPRAPTINARNIDGGTSGRQCWRSGSVHHQCKDRQRWTTWKTVSEVQERPPSTQLTLTVGPLEGRVGGPGVLTINAKKHRRWPPP